jgi:parallel beta-helix repeat protein
MNFRAFQRILSSVILLLSLFSTNVHVQASTYNFTVDVTDDTSDADLGNNICADAQNDCSLRAALEQSKPLTQAGHIVNIYFDLYSPAIITLESDLPQYTEASLINTDPSQRITIDGQGLYTGLFIAGDQNTTIQGLIFEDLRFDGILIYFGGTDTITNNVLVGSDIGIYVSGLSEGVGDVHITGNYIGYDPYTESSNPNLRGIHVRDIPGDDACSVWIGGLEAEDGNVIAGNFQSGIFIKNEKPTTNIVILNNYIGMVDDTTPVANNWHGIEVEKNLGVLNIGGDYLTQGNLIAGNGDTGILIQESASTSIQGNIFSSNAAGTAFIPNQYYDVRVADSPYLRIGGDTPADGNVIPQGVVVESNEIVNQNLKIKHNLLGISKTGFVFPTGAVRDGIWVENATGFAEISFNTITNFNRGIVVNWDSMVPILNNHIYNNTGVGIDLGNDGVTPNDPPPDADTGPNGLQNFPIISNVEVTPIGEAKQVMFDVSIASKPSTTYYIQVFSSPFCSPSGYGEGKQIFYSNPVTTDSNGYGVIEEITDFYPLHIIGPCLTATATEFDGVHYLGTSEFSQGVMAWQPEKLYLPMIVK